MSSPFVFNVAELLRPGADMPEQRRNSGASPSRIGPEMIAIAEGEQVEVEAVLTPLGSGILADARVKARLTGECVRCLRELHPEVTLEVSQVFSATDDFITGDDAEDDEDDVPRITRDVIDLEQSITDEAGLALPFNPTCAGACKNEETNVPAPDGVSGEQEEEDEVIDPRWAGLEKFL